MKGLVTAYRAMAYITGVLIIVLVFIGVPLGIWAHNQFIDMYVGIAHGYLYIAYVVIAFLLSQKLKMKVLSPGVFLLLLAGIVPIMTFVVERWMERTHIRPALAATVGDVNAGSPAPAERP
jgi:integral membrane protein